ncbi:MAG TPA: hypothetical protein H9761_17060 [Candidatus Eisenbergiella merdavium]|uniref:Uncharacterized protein n=1 Tax=Candidatus Eisenbergiella merdavium TaxID=2838551 RepID=A0A9D2SS38_9FIRM|nr:hypothetical protein [Candidatus Eisenbergiella merdavium]
MSRRHYDNKRDLIKEMRSSRARADMAAASAFSANMLMSLYVLRDTFGFGQARAERFVKAMGRLNTDHDEGRITLDEIKKRIFDDLGMIVEMPR